MAHDLAEFLHHHHLAYVIETDGRVVQAQWSLAHKGMQEGGAVGWPRAGRFRR
jgi:hypothetical protein